MRMRIGSCPTLIVPFASYVKFQHRNNEDENENDMDLSLMTWSLPEDHPDVMANRPTWDDTAVIRPLNDFCTERSWSADLSQSVLAARSIRFGRAEMCRTGTRRIGQSCPMYAYWFQRQRQLETHLRRFWPQTPLTDTNPHCVPSTVIQIAETSEEWHGRFETVVYKIYTQLQRNAEKLIRNERRWSNICTETFYWKGPNLFLNSTNGNDLRTRGAESRERDPKKEAKKKKLRKTRQLIWHEWLRTKLSISHFFVSWKIIEENATLASVPTTLTSKRMGRNQIVRETREAHHAFVVSIESLSLP
jgi:hypothetical protein